MKDSPSSNICDLMKGRKDMSKTLRIHTDMRKNISAGIYSAGNEFIR